MPDGWTAEAGAATYTCNTAPSILPDQTLCETTTLRHVFLRKHRRPLVLRLDTYRPSQAGGVSGDNAKWPGPAMNRVEFAPSVFPRNAKFLPNKLECDTHGVTGESYVALHGAAQGDDSTA